MVLQGDLHDCWGKLIDEYYRKIPGYLLLSEMGKVISVLMYYGLQYFPIALLTLRAPVTLLVNWSCLAAI